MTAEVECILHKFTGDTKQGGAVDSLEGPSEASGWTGALRSQQQHEAQQRIDVKLRKRAGRCPPGTG